jgi:hypothetical protein
MDQLLPLPKGAVAVDTSIPLPQGAVPITETAYDRFINNFQLPKMDGNRVVGPMLAAGTGELIKGAGALTELAFPETGRNIARLGDKITTQVKEQYPVSGTTGQIGSYLVPFSAAQKAVNVVKSTPQIASRISNMGKVPATALAVGEQSAIGAGTGYALTPNIENRENAALFGAATGPVGEAIKPLAQGAGYLGKQILGLSTGAGADAVGEAFKAGATRNPQFLANLRGKVPAKDVLQQAQSGLQALKAQRKEAYKQGIGSIKPSQEIVAGQPLPKAVPKLDFNPIENAFKESLDNFKIQGGGDVASTIGEESFKDINKIKALVDEWKSKKGLHTAEGLDGLKRRIDDVYRSDMSSEAQAVLSQTRNTVKDTIIKQDATYAKTMRDYEESLGLERELEQALKLGDKKSIDTAIRSLQSLTRNNANTSYQYRQQLADILKQKSGVDLMPALSGQALNSITPRGLQKLMPSFTAGSAATGLFNVGVEGLAPLATLPLQSPRVVGEGAYMAGKAAQPFINLANSGTQEQRNLAKLLMMKAAQQGVSNE